MTPNEEAPEAPEQYIDIRIPVNTETIPPTLEAAEISETTLDNTTLTALLDNLDPNDTFGLIYGAMDAHMDIPGDVLAPEDVSSDE